MSSTGSAAYKGNLLMHCTEHQALVIIQLYDGSPVLLMVRICSMLLALYTMHVSKVLLDLPPSCRLDETHHCLATNDQPFIPSPKKGTHPFSQLGTKSATNRVSRGEQPTNSGEGVLNCLGE